MDAQDGERPVVNEYKLSEDCELRLEVGNKEIVVELLEGMAEVFGTALTLHKRYTLPPSFRAAIFTYKGAIVEVVGKTESAYIAQQTPMVFYLNVHAALTMMREKAREDLANDPNSLAHGPRLLVTGPVDVGKTTLCRILCNYAVREGYFPTFVDLDIGQRAISVPGSIGALTVEKPTDIVDGFDRKPAYVYNFGAVTPSANHVLYNFLVKELAMVVKKKAKGMKMFNIGGVIVNTCGWIKDGGYDSIINAAEAFEPDVIIVLDHERLYNQLVQELPSFVKIVHLPKSGGVEPRSREVRSQARHAATYRNFYGTKSCPYFPHSFEISYGKPTDEQELLLAKVGVEQLPESCLPKGMKVEDHRMTVVPVPISSEIANRLLALMPPDCTAIDQSLLKKPCLGYIAVTGVDTAKKIITVLSPQPYPLPSKVALVTDVMYHDDNL